MKSLSSAHQPPARSGRQRNKGEPEQTALLDGSPDFQRSYWCFISYKHTDNKEEGRQWASWLHQQLETYEVPEDLMRKENEGGEQIPSRIFPVFRDEEELGAGSNLSERIYAALDRTRVLVVLCSPRVVESTYVDEEIRYFKRIGKADAIYAAVIDGEPGSRVIDAGQCFPESLRYEVDAQGALLPQETEPLAADFRLPDGSQGWTSPEAYRQALSRSGNGMSRKVIDQKVSDYTDRLELAKLKLISGVLKLPLGVLQKRDKAYQLELARKRARTLRRWLGAVAVLGILAVAGGGVAVVQRDRTQQAYATSLNDQGRTDFRSGLLAEGLASVAGSLALRQSNRIAADLIAFELSRRATLVPARQAPPPPPGTLGFFPQDISALYGALGDELRRYPRAIFSAEGDALAFVVPQPHDREPFEAVTHYDVYGYRFGDEPGWTNLDSVDEPPPDDYSTRSGRLVSIESGEAGRAFGRVNARSADGSTAEVVIEQDQVVGLPRKVSLMGLGAFSADKKHIGLYGYLFDPENPATSTEHADLHVIDIERARLIGSAGIGRDKNTHPPGTDDSLEYVRFVGPYFVSQFSNFARRGWRTDIIDCSDPAVPTVVIENQLLPGLVDDFSESTKEFLVRTPEALITFRLVQQVPFIEDDRPSARAPEITGAEGEAWEQQGLTTVSADGQWRAEAMPTGIVRVFDARAGSTDDQEPIQTFALQLNPGFEGGRYLDRMLFLPDSPYLVFGIGILSDLSFTWSVWDFQRGEEILPANRPYATSNNQLIGASPDGRRLLFQEVWNKTPRSYRFLNNDRTISATLAMLAELSAGLTLQGTGLEPLGLDGYFKRRAAVLEQTETRADEFADWLQPFADKMRAP